MNAGHVVLCHPALSLELMKSVDTEARGPTGTFPLGSTKSKGLLSEDAPG